MPAPYENWRRQRIEHRHLHAELGGAICNWTFVEEELCNVLLACLSTDNAAILVEAYYALPSIDNKIRIVDAAVRGAFPKHTEIGKRWGTVANKLNRKKKLRAELAHCQSVGTATPPEAFLVPYFRIHHCDRIPELCVSKPPHEMTMKRLSAKDVRQRSDAFMAMAKDLSTFAALIWAQRGISSTGQEPTPE